MDNIDLNEIKEENSNFVLTAFIQIIEKLEILEKDLEYKLDIVLLPKENNEEIPCKIDVKIIKPYLFERLNELISIINKKIENTSTIISRINL